MDFSPPNEGLINGRRRRPNDRGCDQLISEVESSSRHALLHQCGDGNGEHPMSAAGASDLAEEREPLLALSPCFSCFAEVTQLFGHQSEDDRLVLRVTCGLEAGARGAIALEGRGHLAL